jgi:exoribonuclease II
MGADQITTNSLVIYKGRPARVVRKAERIEIILMDGNLAKVRDKDVIFLHPGPILDLKALTPQIGEVTLAWEILSEEPELAHSIQEVAEMIYDEYSPQSAYAVWQIIEDGLYFQGTPENIHACSPDLVAQEQEKRQRKAAEAQAWEAFLHRARDGKIDPKKDAVFLRETEDLAYGRRKDSLLLRELNHQERPENAHHILLKCAYWDEMINPHPTRLNMPSTSPEIALPPFPDEERLDLTQIPAFAIDDRENRDPDDAISLIDLQVDENGNLIQGSLWVHIADVAALVPPDSTLDLEARARSATLYLPEGSISMIPETAIQRLGLGLNEISPALSFRITINGNGEINEMTYQPTWVKVQRFNYHEAEQKLTDHPLQELTTITKAYQARRKANGAHFIDMPEVIIKVKEGKVVIRQVEPLHSRDMVREAMIMTGEAAAKYAIQHSIPFPYVIQDSFDNIKAGEEPNGKSANPDSNDKNPNYALFYAMRKTLQRSQVRSQPGKHSGLGLAAYSRVTSPIRRYLDLIAHQQLRLFLRSERLIGEADLIERIGVTESLNITIANAEFFSRLHWTLVYLMQNPEYACDGFVIDQQGQRTRVLIPDLAMEINLHLREEIPLNSQLSLKLQRVNLPTLEAFFRAL